jgi:hypothetical protein
VPGDWLLRQPPSLTQVIKVTEREFSTAAPRARRSGMRRRPDSCAGRVLARAGDLVGFYTDAAGNTDGMLATP